MHPPSDRFESNTWKQVWLICPMKSVERIMNLRWAPFICLVKIVERIFSKHFCRQRRLPTVSEGSKIHHKYEGTRDLSWRHEGMRVWFIPGWCELHGFHEVLDHFCLEIVAKRRSLRMVSCDGVRWPIDAVSMRSQKEWPHQRGVRWPISGLQIQGAESQKKLSVAYNIIYI